MVAVHPNRYSHQLLVRSGHFALHILGKDQQALLARFKGPVAAEKFSGIDWQAGVTGCPVLTDCLASIECRITSELTPGNHTLFIGEALAVVFNRKAVPLSTLDYAGCYRGKA